MRLGKGLIIGAAAAAALLAAPILSAHETGGRGVQPRGWMMGPGMMRGGPMMGMMGQMGEMTQFCQQMMQSWVRPPNQAPSSPESPPQKKDGSPGE